MSKKKLYRNYIVSYIQNIHKKIANRQRYVAPLHAYTDLGYSYHDYINSFIRSFIKSFIHTYMQTCVFMRSYAQYVFVYVY